MYFRFFSYLAGLSPIFPSLPSHGCMCMTWNWMRNLEEAFAPLSATLVSETIIYLLEEVSHGSTEVCC